MTVKVTQLGVETNARLCWNCGFLITHQPLPLSTYAKCRPCRAQLRGVAETSSDSRTQLGDLFTAPSDDP